MIEEHEREAAGSEGDGDEDAHVGLVGGPSKALYKKVHLL